VGEIRIGYPFTGVPDSQEGIPTMWDEKSIEKWYSSTQVHKFNCSSIRTRFWLIMLTSFICFDVGSEDNRKYIVCIFFTYYINVNHVQIIINVFSSFMSLGYYVIYVICYMICTVAITIVSRFIYNKTSSGKPISKCQQSYLQYSST
jgi:hypothetical protein